MDCEEVRNLMVLVVYGEADGKQRRLVETHIRQCAACRDYLLELKKAKRVVDALAAGRIPRRTPFLSRFLLRLAAPAVAGILLLLIPAGGELNGSQLPWPSDIKIATFHHKKGDFPLLTQMRKKMERFSDAVKRLRSRIEKTKQLFAKLW